MRKVWLVSCLCVLAVAVLAAASDGATPAGGTVSPAATTTSWQGGPFVVPNPTGVCADAVTPGCDNYSLTISPPPSGAYTVDISTNPSSADDDYDLYVYSPNGTKVGSSASASGHEQVTLNSPAAGTYTVQVVAFMVSPGDTYTGTASMTVAPPPVTPDPSSVQWAWDASKPQESVTVPLRVVMVGFKPGEVDESKVLGEIPNYQQPGVLIPRGQANNPDNADFPFGADTLVNHGRSYYDSVKPFLVPYEYRWQPQVIYAPDAFTTGLFGAMMQNSSTGDFSDSRARTYLEKYNADRGVYRGAANLVTPNAPVRFVNGEPVEDWIAANSQALLGWSSEPKGGKRTSPGTPGYTIYILNTWDSPRRSRLCGRSTSTTSSRSTGPTLTRTCSRASTGPGCGAGTTGS